MNHSTIDPMDNIFHALAHSVRREILDYVMENQACTTGDIAAQFKISRIGVSKHIKILHKAELLMIEKSGRNSLHYFNPVPIQMIYDRWTNEYSQFFASKLNAFKRQLESSLGSETDSELTEDSHEKTA